jgi:hypothetical protein
MRRKSRRKQEADAPGGSAGAPTHGKEAQVDPVQDELSHLIGQVDIKEGRSYSVVLLKLYRELARQGVDLGRVTREKLTAALQGGDALGLSDKEQRDRKKLEKEGVTAKHLRNLQAVVKSKKHRRARLFFHASGKVTLLHSEQREELINQLRDQIFQRMFDVTVGALERGDGSGVTTPPTDSQLGVEAEFASLLGDGETLAHALEAFERRDPLVTQFVHQGASRVFQLALFRRLFSAAVDALSASAGKESVDDRPDARARLVHEIKTDEIPVLFVDRGDVQDARHWKSWDLDALYRRLAKDIRMVRVVLMSDAELEQGWAALSYRIDSLLDVDMRIALVDRTQPSISWAAVPDLVIIGNTVMGLARPPAGVELSPPVVFWNPCAMEMPQWARVYRRDIANLLSATPDDALVLLDEPSWERLGPRIARPWPGLTFEELRRALASGP